jgi:hypothetical protein
MIRFTSFLGCALLLLTFPQPARSQEAAGSEWFPGSFVVAPLRAAPREVKFAGGFVFADRELDDSLDGTNLEAQVALGVRLPVVRFQDSAPGRPAIDLGFEVGVFTRFFMESSEKDQIGTDYRVGFPLDIAAGIWDFRLTALHVSSHFGDDYLDRNPREVKQISREGFELLVGIRPGLDTRIYVGGDLNLGRSVNYTDAYPDGEITVERWAFRFGAEWDPSQWGARKIAPYAAANLQTTDFTERLASDVVAGAAFRVRTVRLLLGAEFHDGPSPMGQFRTVDETWWGAYLEVELWPFQPTRKSD